MAVLASSAVWGAEPAAPAGGAQAEPATIDAKQLRFDQTSHLAYGEGTVVVRYKGAVLQADRVRYNRLTQEAWAEGHVRLTRDGREWIAPAAYYNFASTEMRAEHVRGFSEGVMLWIDSISETGTNHYVTTHAALSTCDSEPPHYRLEATHAEIWPDGRIELHNVVLKLGEVPIFWFPIFSFTPHNDEPPFSVTMGVSSDQGFFFLSSTRWQLTTNMEMVVHLDERTHRGVGGGLDLNYRVDSKVQGKLGGYFISDDNPMDKEDTAAGVNIHTNRYRAQWLHKQYFPNDITLTVDLNKLSDPEIIEDFFFGEFRHERQPDSVADITKRGPNYTLSLLARPQLNNFFTEVERLPEAKLAVNRTRIGSTPFFYEGESSVGEYHMDRGATNDSNLAFVGNAVRADTFHQILMPQTFGGWLSVVPHAGARYTYYSRAPESAAITNEVRRFVFDLGGEASFKISRTWDDVKCDALQVNGLRHILQPFANYQWIPTPNVGTNDLFQFDTVRSTTLKGGDNLVLTRYSPLDFPAYNSIDDITKENVLRFGLRQKLQTRRDGRPWDLVELENWTDWHIDRNKDERSISDLYSTLRLRPVEYLSMDAFMRYDLHANVLRELNTAIRVMDTDRWTVGVGTLFLRNDSNLICLDTSVRLSRHWTVHMHQRFDMQDGEWEEQAYALRQETHDWLITYGASRRNQRNRNDETMVFFAVSLRAFPSMGLPITRIGGIGGGS
jgi:LPS-assembly protein